MPRRGKGAEGGCRVYRVWGQEIRFGVEGFGFGVRA